MKNSYENLGTVISDSSLREYQSTKAISEVFGCLMRNPVLLSQYRLEQDDFIETFHKIILTSIAGMKKAKYSKINAYDMDAWLVNYPTHHKVFENHNGIEYINKAINTCNPENFLGHYEELKKWSLLRALKKNGVDVSDFYMPDDISDGARDLTILRRRHFEECSTADILNFYRTRLFTLDDRYNGIEGRDSLKPGGQGAKDQLEYWKKHQDVGLSYASKYLTSATFGLRKKRFCLSSASSGSGKALPNYMIIPTPTGNKKVGDIKVGDYLFGDDGKPTKVIGVHPQPTEKEIWIVEFADGRKTECCGEHLWEFSYDGHRGKTTTIKTTQEWFEKYKENGLTRRNGGNKLLNKVNDAVEYPEKEYFIHPYAMGLLLGDGSFRYNKTNKSINYSSEDEELPEAIANLCNLFYVKNSRFNYGYHFKYEKNDKKNVWVEELLKDYPELWNVDSYGKFIPDDYLYGSISQRYDLLNGLLDSDGHVDKKGRVSFTTVSENMSKQFVSLCHSLGMKTSIYTENRKNKYRYGVCYTVKIITSCENKKKLFKLARKRKIMEDYLTNDKRRNSNKYIGVSKIYKTDKKTWMTCFTVDNESHLFLCNDYIVTHNTRMALANICYSFSPEYWSLEEKRWKSNPNGTQNRVLYIGTEMELREEIEPILEAYIAGVDESHLKTGKYEQGEEERLRTAADILERSHIYLEYMPDYDLASLENIIEKYNAPPYNVDHVFFDYIHTTTNLINEFQENARAKMQIREDQVLANVGLRLKELTRKYNISIDTATQVSSEFNRSEARDASVIRGAKSLADKADICYILSEPTEKELKKIDSLINNNKGFGDPIKPNRCLSIYKNRGGNINNIKIWMYVDFADMRVKDLFVTNYSYEVVQIPKMQSRITEDGELQQYDFDEEGKTSDPNDPMNKIALPEVDPNTGEIIGDFELKSTGYDSFEEEEEDTEEIDDEEIRQQNFEDEYDDEDGFKEYESKGW